MRTIERLKQEARESAKFRGHTLSRFRRSHYGFYANCECGASVAVTDKPPPNGCEIMGDAVAMNHLSQHEQGYRHGKKDYAEGRRNEALLHHGSFYAEGYRKGIGESKTIAEEWLSKETA